MLARGKKLKIVKKKPPERFPKALSTYYIVTVLL